MEAIPVQTGKNLFDRILDADTPVVVLESPRPEALIEQFRLHIRHSGQAVYVWRRGEGLKSLRDRGVCVPGCLRAADTLRHAQRSRHFGIYLLPGLKVPLGPAEMSVLQRLGRAADGVVRRVVLFSDGPAMAASLGPLARTISHAGEPTARLRLRDGRWVR